MTAPAYATDDDLALYGIAPAVYAGHPEIDSAKRAAMIAARTDTANDYLARYYQIPMVTISQSVTIAVCQLVGWDISRLIGHNPEDPGSNQWLLGRDEAFATLERIAKFGSPGCTDSTPTVVESGWSCSSERRRGW